MKVSRTNDGVQLSGRLPPEISDAASLEIFPLRDGAFLLLPAGMIGGAKGAQKSEGALSEEEKAVVRKLVAVRFEKRTPDEVGKALSKDEKPVLDGLIKKGLVVFFHKGKYEGKGVYNISDAVFNQVREGHAAPPLQKAGAQPMGAAPGIPQQSAAEIPPSSTKHLEANGWMVLEAESDARNFAGSFSERIKTGEIRGVRAFDRKYYLITKGFAEKWEAQVTDSLSKSAKSAEEIGKELGIAPEGCRAILLHLCESGEAMEKHQGKFVRA